MHFMEHFSDVLIVSHGMDTLGSISYDGHDAREIGSTHPISEDELMRFLFGLGGCLPTTTIKEITWWTYHYDPGGPIDFDPTSTTFGSVFDPCERMNYTCTRGFF